MRRRCSWPNVEANCWDQRGRGFHVGIGRHGWSLGEREFVHREVGGVTVDP